MFDLYTVDTRELVYAFESLQDLIEVTREIQDDAYLENLMIFSPEGKILIGLDVVSLMRGEPPEWK